MGCCEALGVSLRETDPGANLGGIGKYPNESFEDQSGERRVSCEQQLDLIKIPTACSVEHGPSDVLFGFRPLVKKNETLSWVAFFLHSWCG